MFADDTDVYFEPSDLFTLQNVSNHAMHKLRHVKKLLDANKLSLKINKTTFVLFHYPARKLTEQIAAKFGRIKISQTDPVKFVGGCSS